MVHNWSLPLEFSTEQLKNFADEVRIVLGEKKVCSALIFFYFLFLKGNNWFDFPQRKSKWGG